MDRHVRQHGYDEPARDRCQGGEALARADAGQGSETEAAEKGQSNAQRYWHTTRPAVGCGQRVHGHRVHGYRVGGPDERREGGCAAGGRDVGATDGGDPAPQPKTDRHKEGADGPQHRAHRRQRYKREHEGYADGARVNLPSPAH